MRIKVRQIVDKYQGDVSRLMDMLIDIQDEEGYISEDVVNTLGKALKVSSVDIEETVSFYHFFRRKPGGKYNVYLNTSVVSNFRGGKKVAESFEKETGIKFGEVTPDGLIGLYYTSCIGMSDQEPAALINNQVFTRLTSFRVRELVADMRERKPVEEMIKAGYGDGQNGHPLVKSIVLNHIRRTGPVLTDDNSSEQLKLKLKQLSPEDVISEIKTSNLRGRGGAGFPTGLKWEFCRMSSEKIKYVVCNADEGEPGTFKDRVILTEKPKLVFEGMMVAGYAIGASKGILYLRYEYRYLQKYLEAVLREMREQNILGTHILGINGFNFDIRIQFGAGAYVCGEESALLESAEGNRGEPRDRPPFPVEKGYRQMPTVVNNVETLCSVVKILDKGAEWWKFFGTRDSSGFKVLSISGDCQFQGVYEIEMGMPVDEMLEMVGADINNIQAVQIGGPSGSLIAPKDFDHRICFSDFSTGGSIIIVGNQRDLIRDVVLNFTGFFMEESCGSCSTCRNIPRIMKNKVEKIISGRGVSSDIDDLLNWGSVLKASRCGLGQTAGNPIITSIQNFKHLYRSYINKNVDFDEGFNLEEAILDSCKVVGRKAELNDHH